MRRFVASGLWLGLVGLTASTALAGPSDAHYARGIDGTFWFMHLSDTHIGASAIEGPNASAHLAAALSEGVDVVDPVFVVVTGDLCDGSILGVPATGQSQEEWDEYKSILSAAGVNDTTFYFDLPGNHDGYADIGFTYYLANSVQGQANNALFHSWTVETTVGDYFFFGLDSAGDGSPQFWEEPEFTADEIAALDSQLAQNADARLSFALAHHPLSTPANAAAVTTILQNNDVGFYMHGHVHEYSEYLSGGGSIVSNQVNSTGKGSGTGASRYDGSVAVGVVDHDAFIYRATNVTSLWPLVMITAPSNQRLRGNFEANPYAYPVCKDATDNPFRAMVFSAGTPTEVTVDITGGPAASMLPVLDSPSIFYALVDTTTVPTGEHTVTVTAMADGVERSDAIVVDFIDGPCDPLPGEDPALGSLGGSGGGTATGGSGGEGGTGTGGTSTGTGTGGTGTGTGTATGTGATGTGTGANVQPVPPLPDEEGGCGCRLAGPRSSSTDGSVAWLGLVGVGAIAARRRGSRRQRSR